MANADLSIRFTDEAYATRLDVMRALNTSLIDSIWRNIEEYRGRFARILSLRDIAKRPFRVIFTPNISDKITGLERKLVRAMSQFSQLDADSSERQTVRKGSYSKILTYVARSKDIIVSDQDIEAILQSKSQNPDHIILANYYATLLHFEEHHHDPIDENYLADILTRLKGESELVSFYREKDFSRANQVVIGKEYDYAPAATIETLMNNLFDFIHNSEISFIVKIIATYYFIDYVKPFETHNEEIAVFLIKSILSHNDIAEASALLPLETLFAMRNDNFRKVFLEVQKTNDLTYALLAIGELVLSEVQDFLDLVTQIKVKEVKREYRAFESDEVPPQKAVVINHPKETQAVEVPKVPLEKKNEIVEQIPKVEQIAVMPKTMAIAKDDDVKAIVKNLIESDPLLRPKQARFYAEHRAVGRYYTIAQYKKEMEVVYETARTSMDNLVQLGYYRRENIKNKFVYTPNDTKKEE